MSTFLLGNERGETLISILIASLVLLIVFMVSTPSLMKSYTDSHKSMARPQFCRDIANNIASQIRSSGIQTKVHRAPIRRRSVSLRSGRWHASSGGYSNLNPGGIVDEHATDGPVDRSRWPARRIMAWNPAANRFVPNSPRIIHSAMNFLQAVNNSNGNRACTQPRGLEINSTTGLGRLLPASTLATYLEAGYFVQASIKVRPYNIANDNLRACNGNLALRPFAAQEPPRSDALGITDNLAGRYDAMTGFKTEIFVTVDHREPDLRNQKDRINCSAKHSFQYDRVVASIPAPRLDMSGNVAVVLETQTQNYFGFGSGPGASLTGTALGTPIQFQPGLFLACAWQYNRVTPLTPPGPPTGNINRWGPCEEINVCGNVGARIIENENSVRVQTNNSIPGWCILNVRAVAFDSVGNTSTETASGCYSGNCQQTTITSTGGGGGGGGGASPPGGYQVNGVSFGGPNAQAAAQAAAALNGAVAVPVQHPPPGALANSAAMQSHLSAVGGVRSTNGTVNGNSASIANTANDIAAASAGPYSGANQAAANANLAAAQANVAAAQANVAAAQANVASANAAVAGANSMPSSMNGVQPGAVTDAGIAEAEAEAALAEAEAALAAAEAAEAAAQAAKDAEDAAAAGP